MARRRVFARGILFSTLAASTWSGDALAAAEAPPLRADIPIAAAAGEIRVDGDLSDPGWSAAQPIDVWYEIAPGTNLAPKARSVGRLAFDSRFLYVGFEFEDPDPSAIRAPFTDRDNVLTSSDYGGVIIDSRYDGRTAQEFLANPRGIQYDGIWSDLVGEDLAPDFYWSAAGRIHERGWTLEMRIPFASLRYDPGAAPIWGITLFRNYPRAFRYELATAPQPADAPCFICNQNRLVGLAGLPGGGSLVAAPFVVGRQVGTPRGGVLGAPLEDDFDEDGGLDLKWTPNSRHAIDLTIRPDFSQVESDVAQLTTNQRFALFFPEKRPFFLEQADLFSTPLPAVYTRTITAPRAGLRLTGRAAASAYTLLLAQDRGGGSVILPGDTASDFAAQDFESYAFIGRVRRDVGNSFVSFLASAREVDGGDGGGFNRVAGPDFQWRPRTTDTVAGQVLWSSTETPERQDLTPLWNGGELEGLAGYLLWQHDDGRWDWFLEGQDIDEEFRADNGFMPQVGYRQGLLEFGRSWDATGAAARTLSKFRLFTFDQYAVDEDGSILTQILSGGFELRGARNLYLRLRYTWDDFRTPQGLLLRREQPRLLLQMAPSAVFAALSLRAYAGPDIDFDNGREGDGAGLAVDATLRPGNHLEVRINAERSILDVDPAGALPEDRLFTADLLRLRATYTFTPRFFVRAIGQRVEVEREPALYTFAVDRREEAEQTSVLLAYKLNWQSVAYLGYADGRSFLPSSSQLEREGREIFLKLSYAFQR